MYICVYICTRIHMYVYTIREHCPTPCWPQLGVEGVSTTGCHLFVYFCAIRSVNDQNFCPGPHSVCLCTRVYSMECMSECSCVSTRGSSFQCTVMYWLLAMAYAACFREGNALPAINLHPVWKHLTSPSTQLSNICTRGHIHFPVFIFQSNRQMPLSFSRSLRERVCGTGLGGRCVTVRSL